jgi:hypothetical protein
MPLTPAIMPQPAGQRGREGRVRNGPFNISSKADGDQNLRVACNPNITSQIHNASTASRFGGAD